MDSHPVVPKKKIRLAIPSKDEDLMAHRQKNIEDIQRANKGG